MLLKPFFIVSLRLVSVSFRLEIVRFSVSLRFECILGIQAVQALHYVFAFGLLAKLQDGVSPTGLAGQVYYTMHSL